MFVAGTILLLNTPLYAHNIAVEVLVNNELNAYFVAYTPGYNGKLISPYERGADIGRFYMDSIGKLAYAPITITTLPPHEQLWCEFYITYDKLLSSIGDHNDATIYFNIWDDNQCSHLKIQDE